MNRRRTIADLFEERPFQWGLRGDPHLWNAMVDYFSQTPLPANADELEERIGRAFLELAGRPIASPEPFFVEKYAHGGMSSGYIDPAFWRDMALPLLKARYADAIGAS
jgi:hypothetical protein